MVGETFAFSISILAVSSPSNIEASLLTRETYKWEGKTKTKKEKVKESVVSITKKNKDNPTVHLVDQGH